MEHFVSADGGKTLILYVGHTQPRTESALFGALIDALRTEPLDPRFHDCLVEPVVLNVRDQSPHAEWNGARVFFGNFYGLALAFRLYTNSKTTAHVLDLLIEKNLSTQAYADARADLAASVEAFRQSLRTDHVR